MRTYVDTSALVKTLVLESESAALQSELGRRADDELVSSLLLHAEVHCAVARRAPHIRQSTVGMALRPITLVDVERSNLFEAATLPGRLRAADAIHLVTALRVGADAMLVYDAELSAAARAAGSEIIAPN